MKMDKSIITNIRAFNRYYTNMIGLLDKGYLETCYTLTEARILFEITPGGKIDTSDIIDTMLIDKSYLSRVLKKFEKNKLITKSKSKEDSRASQISLTEKGMAELNTLNTLVDKQFKHLLKDLSSTDIKELVLHMNSIIEILGKKSANKSK
jgi:DNA-binding MarR family transcriptional regulator